MAASLLHDVAKRPTAENATSIGSRTTWVVDHAPYLCNRTHQAATNLRGPLRSALRNARTTAHDLGLGYATAPAQLLLRSQTNMLMRSLVLVLSVVWSVAACADATRPLTDGGPPPDGTSFDAVVHNDARPPDARLEPDAAPPPPGQSREIVGGGTRMSSATYTFDIEVGHGLPQVRLQGATYSLEGNAAVKP